MIYYFFDSAKKELGNKIWKKITHVFSRRSCCVLEILVKSWLFNREDNIGTNVQSKRGYDGARGDSAISLTDGY